jgi:hypothetical protein
MAATAPLTAEPIRFVVPNSSKFGVFEFLEREASSQQRAASRSQKADVPMCRHLNDLATPTSPKAAMGTAQNPFLRAPAKPLPRRLTADLFNQRVAEGHRAGFDSEDIGYTA